MSTQTIPTGKGLLGRVINVQGQPVDNKGPLTGTNQTPLIALSAQTPKPLHLYETGIKVLDLLAPLPDGGLVGLFAGIGLGKWVIIEELMQRAIGRENGAIVCIGMNSNGYQTNELLEPIREAELEEHVALIFEQTDETVTTGSLLQTGLTVAASLRAEGHRVLLVLDYTVTENLPTEHISQLEAFLRTQDILALGTYSEEANPVENLDARITFSREMAQKNLWPAIDRLASTSQLQGSAEQQQVAQEVRNALQRYAALESGTGSTSPEDEQIRKRGERLHAFFSQPFFVAEPFTSIPGEYVPLTETIQGCKAILSGRYDDVPLPAFSFVGTIQQVEEKARNLK